MADEGTKAALRRASSAWVCVAPSEESTTRTDDDDDDDGASSVLVGRDDEG